MNLSSKAAGRMAELRFMRARGASVIRQATREENMSEHWDLIDREIGRVDVKAQKYFSRGGSKIAYWWELLNVNGQAGWGTDNGVSRKIAFECKQPAESHLESVFMILDPGEIYRLAKAEIISGGSKIGKGYFELYQRSGRKDLITNLPPDFVADNSVACVSLERIK